MYFIISCGLLHVITSLSSVFTETLTPGLALMVNGLSRVFTIEFGNSTSLSVFQQ